MSEVLDKVASIQKNTSIIILAAGQGSRMKSAHPKVLHELLGYPMLGYIIKEGLRLSHDIHIVLGHNKEEVEGFLRSEFGALLEEGSLHTYTQDVLGHPGSGGALMIKDLISRLKGRALVLCGDMPLVRSASLATLLALLDDDRIDGAMGVFDISGRLSLSYGRVKMAKSGFHSTTLGKNGAQNAASQPFTKSKGIALVDKIIEKKDLAQDEQDLCLANAGVYALDAGLLKKHIFNLSCNNAQNEYYLTDIIGMSVDDGKNIAAIMVDEGEFMGVNSKLELSDAERLMSRRVQDFHLANGVIMHNRASIYIDARARLVGECELEGGVVIKGKSIIENSKILANSYINDAVIKNSSIGPMAHIRPKSEIVDSHIGNFTECKNAKIMSAKANHLSYLGDCSVDSGSNIGAGVITCNYDGKAKHFTSIGKDVFVGSDSQLVAPLNIPDSVLIASGTTVTRDMESGDLVISRTKQENKHGFFHRFFKEKK